MSRSGNYGLQDESRTGRPVEFDEDLLRITVEQNSIVTIEELTEILHSAHSTIYRHLKNIEKDPRFGQWVPQELSETNLEQNIGVCSSLLSRLKNEPFLDQIVRRDGNWVLYHNVKHRRQWVNSGETPIP